MDTAYLLDWANLLLRWLHVITVIAWIGASFYFVWLDNHLRPKPQGRGPEGQGRGRRALAVHGGGFYNPQKYMLAPAASQGPALVLLGELLTWMSGLCALRGALPRQCRPDAGGPARLRLGRALAGGAAALGFLVVGWLLMTRPAASSAPGAGRRGAHGLRPSSWPVAAVAGVSALPGAPPLLSSGHDRHLDDGQRRALDHPGPAQGDRRHARGQAPTPSTCQTRQTAQRAQHLVSAAGAVRHAVNHYGMLWQHPHNWAVLLVL